MKRIDTRVPEVVYIVTRGQSFFCRPNDHRDLTGCDITAELWNNWEDREPSADTLEIRTTDQDLVNGQFYVGCDNFTVGGVAFLGIAPTPGAPAVTRVALVFDVRPTGGQ